MKMGRSSAADPRIKRWKQEKARVRRTKRGTRRVKKRKYNTHRNQAK